VIAIKDTPNSKNICLLSTQPGFLLVPFPPMKTTWQKILKNKIEKTNKKQFQNKKINKHFCSKFKKPFKKKVQDTTKVFGTTKVIHQRLLHSP